MLDVTRCSVGLATILLFGAMSASAQERPVQISDCTEVCVELQHGGQPLGWGCVEWWDGGPPLFVTGTCEASQRGCWGDECHEVDLALVVDGAGLGMASLPCDEGIRGSPVFVFSHMGQRLASPVPQEGSSGPLRPSRANADSARR
jgi:hypothetical protein